MSKKDYQRQFKREKIRLHTEVRDFAEKIQPIYQLLDWKWEEIPTVKQIEECLHNLLVDLDINLNSIESGGLKIEQDMDGNEFLGLIMTFKVESDYFKRNEE